MHRIYNPPTTQPLRNPAEEALVSHYRLHGYPKGVSPRTQLAEAEIRTDIHTYVRTRIAQLTKTDPFYLDDPQKTELRIIGSIANIQLMDFPYTEKERAFMEDMARKSPPLEIEDLEKFLATYTIPKKTGLAIEIRAYIAEIMMIRYLRDPKQMLKVLTSRVIQNFLTDIEYTSILKNMSSEVRNDLVYKYTMSHDFEKMDDTFRRLLIESIEIKSEPKNVIHQIVGRTAPYNLTPETLITLTRIATSLENEKILMILCDTYPSAHIVNTMFQMIDEKNRQFILDFAYLLLSRLSNEEKKQIDWKMIFTNFLIPDACCAAYMNHVPPTLSDAARDAVIRAAIAQTTKEWPKR